MPAHALMELIFESVHLPSPLTSVLGLIWDLLPGMMWR